MSPLTQDQIEQIDAGDALSHVVAREGSDLAARLRERGWRATLGWRSESETGSVWLVRFEPEELDTTRGGFCR